MERWYYLAAGVALGLLVASWTEQARRRAVRAAVQRETSLDPFEDLP